MSTDMPSSNAWDSLADTTDVTPLTDTEYRSLVLDGQHSAVIDALVALAGQLRRRADDIQQQVLTKGKTNRFTVSPRWREADAAAFAAQQAVSAALRATYGVPAGAPEPIMIARALIDARSGPQPTATDSARVPCPTESAEP